MGSGTSKAAVAAAAPGAPGREECYQAASDAHEDPRANAVDAPQHASTQDLSPTESNVDAGREIIQEDDAAWQVFHEIDNNKSGKIEKDEWISHLLWRGLAYDSIMSWWEAADVDGSGVISRDEFKMIIASSGTQLRDAYARCSEPPLALSELLSLSVFKWAGCNVSLERIVASSSNGDFSPEWSGLVFVRQGGVQSRIGSVRAATDDERAAIAATKARLERAHRDLDG
eukprot:2713779-Pleurochrysis_carterae.AAC.3